MSGNLQTTSLPCLVRSLRSRLGFWIAASLFCLAFRFENELENIVGLLQAQSVQGLDAHHREESLNLLRIWQKDLKTANTRPHILSIRRSAPERRNPTDESDGSGRKFPSSMRITWALRNCISLVIPDVPGFCASPISSTSRTLYSSQLFESFISLHFKDAFAAEIKSWKQSSCHCLMAPGLCYLPHLGAPAADSSMTNANGLYKHDYSKPQSFALRWLVRISSWYPSKEEWAFLLQLLPTIEQRQVDLPLSLMYFIWSRPKLFATKLMILQRRI